MKPALPWPEVVRKLRAWQLKNEVETLWLEAKSRSIAERREASAIAWGYLAPWAEVRSPLSGVERRR